MPASRLGKRVAIVVAARGPSEAGHGALSPDDRQAGKLDCAEYVPKRLPSAHGRQAFAQVNVHARLSESRPMVRRRSTVRPQRRPPTVGKRRCWSCSTPRFLNTFFRQPPAGNQDRDPARAGCLRIVRFPDTIDSAGPARDGACPGRRSPRVPCRRLVIATTEKTLVQGLDGLPGSSGTQRLFPHRPRHSPVTMRVIAEAVLPAQEDLSAPDQGGPDPRLQCRAVPLPGQDDLGAIGGIQVVDKHFPAI